MPGSISQRKLETFVRAHVYHCQTALIDRLLSDNAYLLYDDIENFYLNDEQVLDMYRDEYAPANLVGGYTDQEVIDLVRDDGRDQEEILEWWIVSEPLSTWLYDEGESLLVSEYGKWWGRTTSGQAIALDYVIEKVYIKYIL